MQKFISNDYYIAVIASRVGVALSVQTESFYPKGNHVLWLWSFICNQVSKE